MRFLILWHHGEIKKDGSKTGKEQTTDVIECEPEKLNDKLDEERMRYFENAKDEGEEENEGDELTTVVHQILILPEKI